MKGYYISLYLMMLLVLKPSELFTYLGARNLGPGQGVAQMMKIKDITISTRLDFLLLSEVHANVDIWFWDRPEVPNGEKCFKYVFP